ncbi:hypothetical protein, conserved [Leishmania tarentolae]|uniref:Uncharacterized protein n=1 Tax=Leishmania tarentolae TaxID=5689 RepID=A0A640KR42_LEITA|nr:hypothetical protein, conserved [Leishmania tarentolae]
MRSLICHRAAVDFGVGFGASSIARSRCLSSFRRLTRTHALRWSCSSISRKFSLEQSGRRRYGTTAVLLKEHQPTNTGASAASSRANGQASRKQPRQKATADYGATGALVEPELDTVTTATTLPLTASSSEAVVGAKTGSVSSAPRHNAGQGAAGRPKALKRGRRKQESVATNATRCASTPSTKSGSSPFTAAPRKGPHDAGDTLPPLEPPTASLVAGEDGIIVAASSSRGKKRGRRGSADSFLSQDATGRAAGGLEPTVTVAANATHAAALTPSSLFGSPQPVYYTHNMMDTAPRTEEQRIAERCSITKLIMVSGSVSFLFTTLPRSEGPLKMYVKDLNRAQAPTHSSVRARENDVTHNQSNSVRSTGQESGGSDHAAAGPHMLPAISEKQFLELRQRLCAEQLATNTVFIHVREMEQLVPPLHLQLPAVTATNKTADVDAPAVPFGEATVSAQREGKTRGRRGRRRGGARSETPFTAPASTSTPPTPPPPALSPVERILGLQAWKKEAERRAKETQARYLVPAHYHAITRVRFHDPHQTDLTVAMGSGWCKSIDSVLRAIVRSMPQDRRGDDSDSSDSDSNTQWLTAEGEEEDGDSTAPPFLMPDSSMYGSEVVTQTADDATVSEQPGFLTSPYTVKPLLTVCASCVPRREAWIGTCAPGPSAAPVCDTESGWSPYSVRAVPTVPRYSTRITIMLEHDEMDPSDLVSLAEISTTRKSSSSAELHQSQDRHKDVSVNDVRTAGLQSSAPNERSLFSEGRDHSSPKKPLHLYCLVQDAGEY